MLILVSVSFARRSVTALSEDEALMRQAAVRFAADEVMPRVEAMDTAHRMDPELIAGLFEGGFMGVEVAEKHGGSGSSFTAACLVVEELARMYRPSTMP